MREEPAGFTARVAAVLRVLQAEGSIRQQSKAVERDLARTLSSGADRIVAGPWLSEIGFEVLYWIPMLNRLVETYGIERDRLTVISRGGAGCWYEGICGDYIDLFDYMTPAELKTLHERRVAEAGGEKQMGLTAVDREILARASDRIGTAEPTLLHPSAMYHAFRPFWLGRMPTKQVLRQLDFRRLPPPAPQPLPELPDEYVAVKAYFSSCFPSSEHNQAFVAKLVARLAQTTNVVLLSTGLQIDDHADVALDAQGSVIDASPWMKARNNLQVQTQIIAGARALVSSYGGFSYLGPFLGVPSVCFYSDRNFNASHLELMRSATLGLGDQRFISLDVRDLPLLDGLLGSLPQAAMP